ncbi:MAG: type II secretion system protein GspE [Ruminococcaceae bacterium]|nr:type II secretion system protein GspE [Oscillospiraceae bacterium]
MDNNTQASKIRIGDLLVTAGYITEAQLKEALAIQKESQGKRVGEVLQDLGYATEKQILTALADRLGTVLIDISTFKIDVEAVRLIPKQMAEEYIMMPIENNDGQIVLAVNDPLNLYAIEDIRQTIGLPVDTVLAELEPLKSAIEYQYAEIKAKAAAENANITATGMDIDELVIDTSAGADDAPIINLVNSLLDKAFQDNASDIHIEPFERNVMVRMRIDGALLDYITLQKNVQDSLVARIKIMGEMDIAERRIPQDGHFRVRIQGQIVNVRVNVIPTVFGEKVVMRLIMSVVEIDHNETFGMTKDAFDKFNEMLKMPNGLIYITGPTGSGKSTTLYNALASLSHKQVNISTIEDPVEKNLPRLNQVQVHPQAGLTFEIGLRALMRQDPDIIMVGETRDAETATIAIRAAITGHLVLSTLHTNDAASTVVRLIDMGAEPYLLSSALAGVVAQRLVRKVCPHCARLERLTEAQKDFVGHDIPTAKAPVGCVHCHGAGYLGRTAIHEVLVVDKEMRKMVAANATAEEMKKYAIEKQGMVTLKQACIKLVEQGITTMEELERVAYYDD